MNLHLPWWPLLCAMAMLHAVEGSPSAVTGAAGRVTGGALSLSHSLGTVAPGVATGSVTGHRWSLAGGPTVAAVRWVPTGAPAPRPTMPPIPGSIAVTVTQGIPFALALPEVAGSWASQAVPDWLAITRTGDGPTVLSGVPASIGRVAASLVFTAANGAGIARLEVSIEVQPAASSPGTAPPLVTFPDPLTGQPVADPARTVARLTIAVSSGTPFTYLLPVADGQRLAPIAAVPAGLSFDDQRGVVGGTPLAPGVQVLSFRCTSGPGQGSLLVVTLIVQPQVTDAQGSSYVLAPPLLRQGESGGGTAVGPGEVVALTLGKALSLAISLRTGDATGIIYAMDGCPAGLVLDPATGVLQGTPQHPGRYQVRVRALRPQTALAPAAERTSRAEGMVEVAATTLVLQVDAPATQPPVADQGGGGCGLGGIFGLMILGCHLGRNRRRS